jgi:hypothetical protein
MTWGVERAQLACLLACYFCLLFIAQVPNLKVDMLQIPELEGGRSIIWESRDGFQMWGMKCAPLGMEIRPG